MGANNIHIPSLSIAKEYTEEHFLVVENKRTNKLDRITSIDFFTIATQLGFINLAETDPIFSASPSATILTSDITNWNTSYSWGDHSLVGYLTVETDPVFLASQAFNITVGDITNLNNLSGINSGDNIQATELILGIAEIATQLEVDTGTDDLKIVTPLKLANSIYANATHTGDVTGSTVLTIANDAVTNSKLANMGPNTIKGRATVGFGDPEDLTPTNARLILNVEDGATANVQATETVAGIAEIATQTETNTGIDDTTFITPLKLKNNPDKDLVKVSLDDTTPGYLEDKLIKYSGLIRDVLNPGANEQVQFRLGDHYLALASTGLYTGAELSIGATTGTFDLSIGEGLYVDSTTDFSLVKDNVFGVTIPGGTNIPLTNILTQPVTYILVDNSGAIIQQSSFPTPTERRTNIFIGVVVHSDNINVNAVNNEPEVAVDITAQIGDLMQGLGFFNLQGNVISPNGANLSINKSSGEAFKAGANYINNKKDPHTLTLGTLPLATFRYRNQDSSEGSDITVLDPTTYDLGGVTTAIGGSNNQATIQRIYIFPSNTIRVQRGQQIFTTMSDAIDAVGKEPFITETNIEENGLLLASIVIRKGAIDLSLSTDALIFKASRFGELGSVGSSATTNLQQAYDNSIPNPEILTNDTNGPITHRRGTTGGDTDDVYEVQNNAGTQTFKVQGDGDVRGLNIFKKNLTAVSAPLVSNDNTEGYEVGSEWIDITNDKAYKCLDASTGASIWKETTIQSNQTWEPPKLPIGTGATSGVSVFRALGGGLQYSFDGTSDDEWSSNMCLMGTNGVIYDGSTFSLTIYYQLSINASITDNVEIEVDYQIVGIGDNTDQTPTEINESITVDNQLAGQIYEHTLGTNLSGISGKEILMLSCLINATGAGQGTYVGDFWIIGFKLNKI